MNGLHDVDIVRVMLVKDIDSPYRSKQMRRPGDPASIAKEFLAGEDREVFIAINLDHSNKINSIHIVAIGSSSAAIIEPREVFKTAILSNASFIIMAHNHPSGNPEPSPDDIKVTRQLFECGKLLNIKILDHIIVGDGKYTSVRLEGGEICLESRTFEDNQRTNLRVTAAPSGGCEMSGTSFRDSWPRGSRGTEDRGDTSIHRPRRL